MELLAKSKDSRLGVAGRTLKEHIDDCLAVWTLIKVAFPQAATLSGMGPAFWEVLRLSIILHDTGKAHREFQQLLQQKPHKWNSQRHELFSIPFVEAILKQDKALLRLVRLVVAGHHKDIETLLNKVNYYLGPETEDRYDGVEDIETYEEAFRHVDVAAVCKLLSHYELIIDQVEAKSINQFIYGYLSNPIQLQQAGYFTLMLLMGGLKWCDHLGSAMATELKMIADPDFTFLEQQRKSLLEKGGDFYEHQIACSNTSGNLLLTAPTGSGKTESALLWLRKQVRESGQGRIFYILPYTASINAMYERIDKVIGEGKAGMLHGKLNDYLNNYFDDLQYTVESKKENIQAIKEKFKSVVTPLKVATPFQLLKHLFGLKGYEQGIFEMTGSYLVFDEIHAYNPETLAQIKVLLEFATGYLNARVMIMTATMPTFMQAMLESSIGEHRIVKADRKVYDQFKRHRVELREGLLSDGLAEIKRQLNAGRQVLVVCNTVRSSQHIFEKLKSDVQDGEALLLHGSFSGADRAKKEKQLSEGRIQLLVGTQAIEVSLDIDYDVLFTEAAPIDALIQRFGRVNRRRIKGVCPCIVFTTNHASDFFIYRREIIVKTLEALQCIIISYEGIIDEGLLQQSIDKVYPEWDKTDKEKFDDQYTLLKGSIERLSPLFKNKNSEEDFYDQFDGIKLLPQANRAAYEKYLNTFDFINAESQKVQIRKGRLMQWKQSGNIKSDISVFARNNRIQEQRYFITNKKYNEELGLIADEEDPWNTAEIL